MMGDVIFRFFGAAKELRLSGAERGAMRDALLAHFHAHPVSNTVRAAQLTRAERDEVRGNLIAYMRAHPVRGCARALVSSKIVEFFTFHRLVAASLCAVLLLGAGGSVVYAAESALPDELLYPVKVHFTEPIMGALYRRSPERRARWEERRLERRLEEAERLLRYGRLTEELRSAFERRLEERVERFEQKLQELPSDEAREELRERVNKHLERRESVLRSIEKEAIAPEQVRQIRGQMRNVRARLRQPLPTLTPFRGKPEEGERGGEDREGEFDAKKNMRETEKRKDLPLRRRARDLLPMGREPPLPHAGESSAALSAPPEISASSQPSNVLKKPERKQPPPLLPRLHLWPRK